MTFIVIIVVCLLAFVIIFLDSFRLFKYLKSKFCSRKLATKVGITSKNKIKTDQMQINDSVMQNYNYNDLEYNLYKSFLIAKHKGSLR